MKDHESVTSLAVRKAARVVTVVCQPGSEAAPEARALARLEDVEKVVRELERRAEILEEMIDAVVMWFTTRGEEL